MMYFSSIALVATALLAYSTGAAPTTTITTTLTEAKLLAIAPSSNTCVGATYPAECRTAKQALQPIVDSFKKYQIGNPAVQATIISLIAYESGDFKYNVKHFPSTVPGVGTRNMQSANYNVAYAKSLGKNMDQVFAGDGASFGSAAWFVTANCPFEIRKQMWTGSQAAWEGYVTKCVGATMDDRRVKYWQTAMAQLTKA